MLVVLISPWHLRELHPSEKTAGHREQPGHPRQLSWLPQSFIVSMGRKGHSDFKNYFQHQSISFDNTSFNSTLFGMRNTFSSLK